MTKRFRHERTEYSQYTSSHPIVSTRQRHSQGGAEGVAAPPPLSLIERFSNAFDTPKRGKNDVEMP